MITYSEQEVVDWLAVMAAGQLHLDQDNMRLASAAIALIQGQHSAEPALPPGYLSPNFTEAEFTFSATADSLGIDNTPPAEAVAQLTLLANMMEEVRKICGNNPVMISSGYRCSQLNAAVGGSSGSAHMYGAACDFTIPGFGTAHQVWAKLSPLVAQLGIDQLIDERGGGAAWVHVGRAIPPSTAPRHQCFAL